MIREDIVVGYINNLKGSGRDEVLQRLNGLGDSLSSGEKNTVYTYLFPGNLLDGELADQLKQYGGGGYRGIIGPNDVDLPLLVNAYGSRQYKGYIRHLLHSFIKVGEQELFSLDSPEGVECGLCKMGIFGLQASPPDKEHLAYGSQKSDVFLCPSCLYQLNILDSLLRRLEGKDYLIWGNVIGRI